MKSFVAYIMVIALVGGAVSARRMRRQAPAGGPPPIPAAGPPPAPDAAGPPPAPDAAEAGGAPADLAVPSNSKVDGLNTALGFILDKLDNQTASGLPADPKKVEKVLTLSLLINVLGGDVSADNNDKISKLLTEAPPVDDVTSASAETA